MNHFWNHFNMFIDATMVRKWQKYKQLTIYNKTHYDIPLDFLLNDVHVHPCCRYFLIIWKYNKVNTKHTYIEYYGANSWSFNKENCIFTYIFIKIKFCFQCFYFYFFLKTADIYSLTYLFMNTISAATVPLY